MNDNSSLFLNSSSTSAEGGGDSASSQRSRRDRSADAGSGVGAGARDATAASSTTSAAAARVTRTGKIARLPQAIRQRLNERLADGEPQQILVAWLNEHAVVRERLERFHGGRAITEQNLSDWKAGGFRDWERHQETRGMLREFLHETEELSAELGGEENLLERATNSVALALVQLLRDAMAGNPRPEERQAVLQIARELDRMRRVSHERQRVQLLVEKAQEGKKPILPRTSEFLDRLLLKEEKKLKEFNAWLRMEAETLRAEYVTAREGQALTPERRQFIEGFFDRYAADIKDLYIAPLPRPREPKGRAVKKQSHVEGKSGEAKPACPAKSAGGRSEKKPSASGSQPPADDAATDGNPE